MFGDIRALQELKSSAILANFDSQFIEGVKGVAPCTFVDKGEPIALPTCARCAGMCGVLTAPRPSLSRTRVPQTSTPSRWTSVRLRHGPARPASCRTTCSRSAAQSLNLQGRRLAAFPGRRPFPASAKWRPRSSMPRAQMQTASTATREGAELRGDGVSLHGRCQARGQEVCCAAYARGRRRRLPGAARHRRAGTERG